MHDKLCYKYYCLHGIYILKSQESLKAWGYSAIFCVQISTMSNNELKLKYSLLLLSIINHSFNKHQPLVQDIFIKWTEMKICFIIYKKCPPILHRLNKIPIELNIIYKKNCTNVTRKTK